MMLRFSRNSVFASTLVFLLLAVPRLGQAAADATQASAEAYSASGALVFFNESSVSPVVANTAAASGLPVPPVRNHIFLVDIMEDKQSANRGAKYRVVHQWPNEDPNRLKIEEGSPAYLTKSGLAGC